MTTHRDGPEIERVLLALARDALGTQDVSMADDLVGHGQASLVAVRMIIDIEKHLGIEMPLACVFDCRSVAELAAAVTASLEAQPDQADSLRNAVSAEALSSRAAAT